MKKILILIIATASTLFSQTVYEVQPGTKGNEISLTITNVSEENPATEVIIKSPTKPPLRGGLEKEVITFHQPEHTIDMINPGEEKEVTFTFDVNRNAPINKKDTIDFMITSPDGIWNIRHPDGMMTKQFIFSYTAPKVFKLEQNFPNPFNPATRIQYQVSSNSEVTLRVFDILGSEVVTLVNEEQQPGYYEVQFNAANFASGMYVYRLQAKDYVSTKKMLMIK